MSREYAKAYRLVAAVALLLIPATAAYVFADGWDDVVRDPNAIAAWEKLILSLGLGVVMSLIMAGMLILTVRFVLIRNERREQRLMDLLEAAQQNLNKATVDHAVAVQQAMGLYRQSCDTLGKIADELKRIEANK